MSHRDGVLEANIKTTDVKETLSQAARKHKVSLEDISFTIHQCSEARRSGNHLYREYLIDIFTKGLYPVVLKYHIQQRVKDGRKEAYLHIDDASEIDLSIATPLEVLTEIKKILAYEGVIFGIIADELLYEIAVQVYKASKENQPLCPEPYLVARGQAPKSSELPGPTLYHFDHQGGVAKGRTAGETFLVREGELLVTEPVIRDSSLFITPNGSIVLPGNLPPVVFTETSSGIRREESADEIRYFAESAGYLSIENGVLTLRSSAKPTPGARHEVLEQVQTPASTPKPPPVDTPEPQTATVEKPQAIAEEHAAPTPAARKAEIDMRKLSDAQKTLLKVKKLFSLFEGLTNEGLLQVTSEARIIRYKKFDIVFEQGSAGKEIYFIINGVVDVMVGTRHDIGNLERYIDHFTASRLTQGSFFGEMAPITGEKRSARCVCSSNEAVLLCFKVTDHITPQNAMQMAILYQNFVKALAAKLKSSNEAIAQS